MARIRNIKPAFFRHEVLQDLEAAHPGQYVMLVYAALWTHCDAQGRFQYRPRTLKLDILPFLEYNLETTLRILEDNQLITTYTAHDGERYGFIPTFEKHQRITGKEASDGAKYPDPDNVKQPGNNRETTGKQPDAQGWSTGKDNREREGVHAHAHEGNDFQNQKTADDPPPETTAPAPGSFTAVYRTIFDWCETDAGHAQLIEIKRITGYRDSSHGATTDELTKFVSWHLSPKNHDDARRDLIRDPVEYFLQRFPGWLTNAKSMNKPPRDRPPANAREYRPPPAGRRSAPATAAGTPLAAILPVINPPATS